MYRLPTTEKRSFLVILFMGLLAMSLPTWAQSTVASNGETSTVQWMTFEQAMERSKTEKRKLFIDVYTDWCGWCKVMDRKTFSDPKVARMLNERFYPVKFNAEQLQDVQFNGQTYRFVPQGRSGYHQLAAGLLNNQLSYPTVVFMDEELDLQHAYAVPGYRNPAEFHPLLVFFGDNHHKQGAGAWENFQKDYKSPF